MSGMDWNKHGKKRKQESDAKINGVQAGLDEVAEMEQEAWDSLDAEYECICGELPCPWFGRMMDDGYARKDDK